MVDLLPIKSLAAQYADLFATPGVDVAKSLNNRNAKHLVRVMSEVK